MKIFLVSSIIISLVFFLSLLTSQGFAEFSTIEEKVSVGHHPSGVAVNLITNMIYVNNYESASVSVIDGATNSVSTTIQVGGFPSAIGVNPDTNRVYVIYRGLGFVSVIDGETNKVIGEIEIEPGANDLAVDPTTNMIYVSYSSNGDVLIIDGSLDKIIDTIPLGDVYSPLIAVNPSTNTLYASDGSSIYAIDGKTKNIAGVINIGGYYLLDMVVSADTNKLYVLAGFSQDSGSEGGRGRPLGSLIIMEGSTNTIAKMNIGLDVAGITVNPITNDVYVSYEGNRNGNFVVLSIDGIKDTIKGSVEISGKPGKLAFNPNNDSLYMINEATDSLTIIGNATAIPEFPSLTLLILGTVFAIIFLVKPVSRLKFKM